MKQAEIIQRLKTAVKKVLQGREEANAELTLQTNLKEDLRMESLDMIDLLLNVEIIFGIKIDMGVSGKIKTISDLVDIIQKQL